MQGDARAVRALLSKEEWQQLHTKSNWRATWTLLFNWGLVAVCLTMVGLWPNPVSILLALVLIGGRQLGIAVLMHDCGHRGLFTSAGANHFVGRWLCGAPVFSDLDTYAQKHLRHHLKAGSHDDPDLNNYKNYAISKWSFRRKIARDLVGWTGIRTLLAIARGGGIRLLWRPLLVNTLLFGMLAAWGHPLLYLLWIGAWLTTNMLVSRLRQAAEHAVVPDLYDPDPRLHTRTTIASWWERLVLAPNSVNFHLEHHLLPSVPPYRLKRLHHLMRERGFYDQADIANGYREVMARLTSAGPAAQSVKSSP